ncbi:MAG: hypothetical protein ACUVRS_08375 [Armatimonadota bacterium]
MSLLIKLQDIDRRWLYLALATSCLVPFLVKIRLPVYVSPETRRLYEAIDKCPPNKVVLVDSAWDAGSLGENWGQVEVVFDHMLRKGIKFVVISLDITPLGPQFADKVISKLVKTKYPHRKYGVDWVNLGFTKGDWQAMQQIAKDIRRQFKRDSHGWSLDDSKHLPLMQKVRNIDDIYMIYSVTYSPLENWIPFVHGVYETPIGFGCAGIQSTTYYRYILSKQLVGMLVGVRGAAEYDALLYPDTRKRESLGTQLIVPQAFGHTAIIVAVILGNIGYFASRKRERKIGARR